VILHHVRANGHGNWQLSTDLRADPAGDPAADCLGSVARWRGCDRHTIGALRLRDDHVECEKHEQNRRKKQNDPDGASEETHDDSQARRFAKKSHLRA
jgi:hypothetical protein